MPSPTSEIKPKAVRAGAGAGKTYNLTHQVLDFAIQFHQSHGRWPHIMVTTFTRKATQELSERLIKLSLSEKPETLEFTTSSLFLKVSTIHGILDHFLKQYGHHIDLCGDFSYLRNSEADFLSRKILKEILEKDFKNLLEIYNFSTLHSMLVETLSHDLKGYRALTNKDLLALLNSKLRDYREKINYLIQQIESQSLPEIWQETNAILKRISVCLDTENYEAGYSQLIDLVGQFNLRKGYGQKKDENAAVLYESFKSLVNELRVLKKDLYDPSRFSFYVEANQSFSGLREMFVEQLNLNKKSQGKIEIVDLENFSLELIRKYPHVARKFAQDWDYWLIDEFQDTSPVQVEILNQLVGKKPYYIVGDPQQSIYLFRGARSEVFAQKFKEIEAQQGDVDHLQVNYRSTASLLHFINYLSGSLGEQFQTMTPKEEVSKAESVCTIKVFEPEEKEQGDELELAGIGEHLMELSNKGISYGEVAILGRKHKDLEKIAQYLKSKNIPVHLHSGGLFWKRREILDALILLKFLINPNDDFNLACLLRIPLLTINESDIVDLFHEKEGSVWGNLKPLLEEDKLGRSGQLLLKWYEKRNQHGIVVCFQRLLVDLGFFDAHVYLDSSERVEGNLWKFIHLLKTFERERGANFIQFINEAEKSSKKEKETDAIGAVDENKVNIMTVHASKGLQFDYVFLPFLGKPPYIENKLDVGVDEKMKIWSVRAPSSSDEIKTSASLFEKHILKQQKEKELEENLRVFYVAYTRAKRGLYMSWCRPIKEHSWAKYLQNINLTPGSHQTSEYVYHVSHNTKEIDRIFYASEDLELPKALNDLRKSYPHDEREEATAVTQRVSDERLTTYKHSFLNKQRGILFHRLLETFKYPDAADVRELIVNWFPEDQEEVSKAINYLLNLSDLPIVDLIQKGHVEWPFVTHLDGQRTEGQIDLWGIVDDTLWVVDYKSGKKVLKDKAFNQLALYAQALKKYLQWPGNIQLAVIYPFVQEHFVEQHVE